MLDFIVAKLISELSVFLPTYNEEENISATVLNTKKVLEEIAETWELIIVNDGSSDGTVGVVQNLIKGDNRIKIINHKINHGYGSTLRSGFYGSKYKWIAFTDSDGQFDFSEITKFIEKQKEANADLVIGYYKKRQVSKFKIITSKMWEIMVVILFGLKVHDIDCGFKLISRKVIDMIPHMESERGAFISSELLIKAKNKGFKIVEVPVTHYPRTKGTGTGRNLNVILKSFLDLLRLWKKLK
ncbi:MAG: glycosyltransferase family 2 protein [Candidatus Margulisiibacteriota bacterium]|jgi:glycosyltransferase involved in cell wall biosynthesis